MSNDQKNKSDFDKLFDDLFKDEAKKDNKSPHDDEELDDDIFNQIFNSKKNSDKEDDDKLKAIQDDKDDNFDWLKELIDDIDREEQDKKKIASNAPVVEPKPVKPSFTSKLSEAPRPPKPPEHIANWGLGKKTVILPQQNDEQSVKSKNSFLNKKRVYIYVIFFITCLASIAGFLLYNMLQSSNRDLYHASNVIMRNVYSGDKILIDTQEVTDNGLDVIEKGYIDAHISNLMYRLVHPGEKVIDVGAGFGYYTLYLARIVGSAGQVYSFEGRKHIFELLDSSVHINKFGNVKTFNNILFAENRRLLLDTHNGQKRSNFGALNLVLENESLYSNNDNREFVDGMSLDTVLADVTNISMLHINANGNELSIILGAQRLIAASPKIKIITSWSKHQMTKYVNVNNIVTQLVDSGFRFWLIKPSNGTLIELSTVEHILQVERGRFLIAKSLQ